MKDAIARKSDSRGSKEVWLDAAFKTLIEKGVAAVKIQPLANELGLSRTSFYWCFEDRQALLNALIDDWNRKNTQGLIGASQAYADTPAEAVLNVISAFLDPDQFDARLDFAVRSWALQDSLVMEQVRDADELRLSGLRELLEQHGFAKDDADVRSRTIYLTQIGYISMQVQESIETRMARIPGYVLVFTGQEPSRRELARFYARHDFRDPLQK